MGRKVEKQELILLVEIYSKHQDSDEFMEQLKLRLPAFEDSFHAVA